MTTTFGEALQAVAAAKKAEYVDVLEQLRRARIKQKEARRYLLAMLPVLRAEGVSPLIIFRAANAKRRAAEAQPAEKPPHARQTQPPSL